jgi:hypothetical protein
MFVLNNEVQKTVVQWFCLQHKEFLETKECQLVQQWNSCLHSTATVEVTLPVNNLREATVCTCLMSWNYWAFINTHCLPCNVLFLGIFPLILLSALQLLTCAILSRDFCKHKNIIWCVLPNLGLWAFESVGFVLFDVVGLIFELLLRKKA